MAQVLPTIPVWSPHRGWVLTQQLYQGGRCPLEHWNEFILSFFLISECACFIFSNYSGDLGGLHQGVNGTGCADGQGWGCSRTRSPSPHQWHILQHRLSLGVFKPPGIKVKAKFHNNRAPASELRLQRQLSWFIPPNWEIRAKVGEIKDFIFHLFSVINERGFPLIPPQRVSTEMVLAGRQCLPTPPSKTGIPRLNRPEGVVLLFF